MSKPSNPTSAASAAGTATLGIVARGLSWVAAGHAVSQLAWFGSLLLVAAMLPPGAFGSVTIAMVLVQVAWLVVGSGTRGSFVVAEHVTRAQVRYALGVNVGVGLVVGTGVAILAEPIVAILSPGADVAVVRVLALSIAIYGLSIVPLALLQKGLRFKRHAAANAGAAGISSIVAVLAAVLGAGVWALVARQILFQALLSTFAWFGARGLVPAAEAGERRGRAARPAGATWFFLLATISFVALNVDYVVVARVTDVTQLGIYALAFTMAFAPMTQFAWQIGKVLFPAAARSRDSQVVGQRASKAVRLTGLVVLPAAPIVIALAPVMLPRLLGPEWSAMVVVFQILVVAGVVQALLAVMREFLLGSGAVAFCVRTEAFWLASTAGGLVLAVSIAGIRGAALTHLALVVPLTWAYGVLGAPRLGSSWRALWQPLVPLLRAVAFEVAAVAVTVGAVRAAGAPADAAWLAGAAAGVAGAGLALGGLERGPLREGRAVLFALRPREGSA
jgi:O-antigen/teichoic acid export membrane protein